MKLKISRVNSISCVFERNIDENEKTNVVSRFRDTRLKIFIFTSFKKRAITTSTINFRARNHTISTRDRVRVYRYKFFSSRTFTCHVSKHSLETFLHFVRTSRIFSIDMSRVVRFKICIDI